MPAAAATPARSKRAARRRPGRSSDHGQRFVIENASWDLYERLLREGGERPLRLTYDNGRLELMSPLPEHGRPKRLLNRFILMMTFELRMPMASFGSTTVRLKPKRQGLEPDECYYFANESRVRGRRRIDLKRDPPPDLVIEIDISSTSVPREPIYAAMGVPELWRYNGRAVQCMHLLAGAYRLRRPSLTFPSLNPADLGRFVNMLRRTEETAIAVAFKEWADKRGLLKRPPAAG